MSHQQLHSREGVQKMLDASPIHRFLAFRAVSVPPIDEAILLVLSAPVGGNAGRTEGADQAHGGAVATLVDTTATFAASRMVDALVPTMSLQVNYLRPACGTEMRASAVVRRAGRTVATVDVDVEASGKLVAIGRATFAVSG